MSKCVIPTAEGGWKHVFPLAFQLTAEGGKPLPPELGLEDPWKVGLVLRKRACTEAGEPILFDGVVQEMPESGPGDIAIADLLHDPQVQALLPQLMDCINRLITGDLAPLPAPENDE